jgi:hypothetical protein
LNYPIAKTPMGQKHKIQLANFDKATLRVIWSRSARFWVGGHIEMNLCLGNYRVRQSQQEDTIL